MARSTASGREQDVQDRDHLLCPHDGATLLLGLELVLLVPSERISNFPVDDSCKTLSDNRRHQNFVGLWLTCGGGFDHTCTQRRTCDLSAEPSWEKVPMSKADEGTMFISVTRGNSDVVMTDFVPLTWSCRKGKQQS
jgi:hypothetical protein